MSNLEYFSPRRNRIFHFWDAFMRFGEAFEITEAEILAERVTRLERELSELRDTVSKNYLQPVSDNFVDSLEYCMSIGS